MRAAALATVVAVATCLPAAPAAAGWDPPVPVNVGMDAGDSPRVAVSGYGESGTAVVAWIERRQSGAEQVRELLVATVSPGGPPSPPEQASPPGADVIEHAAGIDALGRVTAAWIQSDGTHDRVYARRIGAAGQEPVAISDPGRDASDLSLAVAPGGTATLVWLQRGAAGEVLVETRTLGTSGAAGPASLSLSDPGADAATPRVVVDPGGWSTVVWRRAGAIQAAQLDDDGAPLRFADDRFVATLTDRSGERPRVAVDADGIATVTWLDAGGALNGRRILVADGSLDPSPAEPPLELATGGVTEHAVASDAAGVVTAAWIVNEADGSRILARRIHPDGNVDAAPVERAAATGGAAHHSALDLAVDARGAGWLSWVEGVLAPEPSLHVQPLAAEATMGPAGAAVELASGPDAGPASLAPAGDGRAVLARSARGVVTIQRFVPDQPAPEPDPDPVPEPHPEPAPAQEPAPQPAPESPTQPAPDPGARPHPAVPASPGGSGTPPPPALGGDGEAGAAAGPASGERARPGSNGPQVEAARLSPTRFAAAPASRRRRVSGARYGAILRFRARNAAHLEVTVERSVARRGRRCRRPGSMPATCFRWTRMPGRVVVAAKTGEQRLRLDGRWRGRRLAPGRYRLSLVAVSGSQRSPARLTGFEIVVPPRGRTDAPGEGRKP